VRGRLGEMYTTLAVHVFFEAPLPPLTALTRHHNTS
jgi:hypothetical protein